MGNPRLLIIDDDEHIRTQMKWALVQDYDVCLARDGEQAMEALQGGTFPLILLDLGLPPDPEGTSEGLRLLGSILGQDPASKVIVLTGNPDRSAALSAVSLGAHDFFTKPIDLEELKHTLRRAHYVHTLEAEYKTLQAQPAAHVFGGVTGTSGRMQEIFSTIRKVADKDVPVLITGESGTGKEIIARAIHSHSSRLKMPFVAINCGAIPENLMETELFGHEKGAFTGAHAKKAGRIELAQGGTLFLDEIGELPLQLQVKLLRFLQDHSIEKVGGGEPVQVDLRVIAATNRDLTALIKEGRFREDLYYRLAVVSIEVPPLRERGEDMVLLARTFLGKYSEPSSAEPKLLSRDALDAILAYDWPGNVREMENRVRRALALSEGPVVTSSDLGFAEKEQPQTLDLRKARENLDVKLICTAISMHNGNISKAAEELGLSRPTLHQLVKKYNITTKLERSN
ncbi:MAG: PEP-CTERM-box response regulator transcription factor [Thermodesulfobacteriota bacterium]|nr:MAG: PEP-CTERM-box response regulator transcription factor [Thermodesulfobacteriota bacterium]